MTRRVLITSIALTLAVVGCGDDDATVATSAATSIITTTTVSAVSTTTLAAVSTTDTTVPACDAPALTAAQTEGPYYTPDTPERSSLREEGETGTPLVITGMVLTADCRPVAGAWLDVWHADADGVYDNTGYRYRGHLFADTIGTYRLETIVPGLYPGRTRHIHVKVQASGGPVLTTQLYFPDEPLNAGDGLFDPSLVMRYQPPSDVLTATFDFVVTGP